MRCDHKARMLCIFFFVNISVLRRNGSSNPEFDHEVSII